MENNERAPRIEAEVYMVGGPPLRRIMRTKWRVNGTAKYVSSIFSVREFMDVTKINPVSYSIIYQRLDGQYRLGKVTAKWFDNCNKCIFNDAGIDCFSDIEPCYFGDVDIIDPESYAGTEVLNICKASLIVTSYIRTKSSKVLIIREKE